MQLTQHESYIQQYDDKQITINNVTYHETILVTEKQVIATWPLTELKNLTTSHLSQLMEHHPDVVIIGTGKNHQPSTATLQKFFAEHKMGFEVMNTGAACRTFNILLAENRHVGAILMIS